MANFPARSRPAPAGLPYGRRGLIEAAWHSATCDVWRIRVLREVNPSTLRLSGYWWNGGVGVLRRCRAGAFGAQDLRWRRTALGRRRARLRRSVPRRAAFGIAGGDGDPFGRLGLRLSRSVSLRAPARSARMPDWQVGNAIAIRDLSRPRQRSVKFYGRPRSSIRALDSAFLRWLATCLAAARYRC